MIKCFARTQYHNQRIYMRFHIKEYDSLILITRKNDSKIISVFTFILHSFSLIFCTFSSCHFLTEIALFLYISCSRLFYVYFKQKFRIIQKTRNNSIRSETLTINFQE